LKNHWFAKKPSQAKLLTEGGDLREARVDIPLSVTHSCVCAHCWTQTDTFILTGDMLTLTVWSQAKGLD